MSLATEAGTVTDGHVGLPNVHVDVLEGMVMPSLSVGTGCDAETDAEAEADADAAVDKLMLPTMSTKLDAACSGIIGGAHVRVDVKLPREDPELHAYLTERGLQWRTCIVGDEGATASASGVVLQVPGRLALLVLLLKSSWRVLT